MSNYPPPPQAGQQHYNALYPTAAEAPQMLHQTQQEHLQFSSLNQPIYPKATSAGQDHNTPSSQHIQNLAQELSHHAAIEEQQRHHLQQATHDIQQSTPVTSHPSSAMAQSHATTQSSASEQAQKILRLRKACDSCSIRKVKCDESGPPCRACVALDIPCTFERPSRRRGPPNRHAEAIKRRRLGEHSAASSAISATSPPGSPTHAAQALAALSGHSSAPASAESICPLDTLELLIDDFFTYVHPSCPFPHQPSFREAWKRREDLSNKSFLALLASMIGALVAAFPRKPRLHLKLQRRDDHFPSLPSLVQRCQALCAAARGPGYLETANLNVYDAATSYFLALTGIHTSRWRLGRLYFGECLTILRSLGLHKSKAQFPGSLSVPTASQQRNAENEIEDHVDNITLEIGRRIFWTIFVSVKSMQQMGADLDELIIPPPTHTEPYPPLPAEVDDFCIYPTYTEQQPKGLLPMTSGFNANVRVYNSFNALATIELAWGIDAIVDRDRQKRVLHEALRLCKVALNDLPPELTLDTFGLDAQVNDGGAFPTFTQPRFDEDPAISLMSLPSRPSTMHSDEDRRRLQYESQKASIYASSLATRSYIVEKYWRLCEGQHDSRLHPNPSSAPSSPSSRITAAGIDGLVPQPPASQYDTIDTEMTEERERVVKDLLTVLASLEQINMEPYADSFVQKLRSTASTLLQVPDRRKGPLALQAQPDLCAFLDLLTKLEDFGLVNGEGNEQVEDDAGELQMWAELRERQGKLMMLAGGGGGGLGLS